VSVIWHDLECGSYGEDLTLWRRLAAEYGDPVLDVGAGTGRVALELARGGRAVVALDHQEELLNALTRRAQGLNVQTVCADARDFELRRAFPLCVVPMQTIQLLGGSEARMRFLHCVRRHLSDGGMLAIAVAPELELYETDAKVLQVPPDMSEVDGVLYSSQPVAIRARRESYVLVRRRERVDSTGRRRTAENVVRLDRLAPAELEREGVAARFAPSGRQEVAETAEYAGSVVVMLSA
jgi:SAM-dependent methyltransferase